MCKWYLALTRATHVTNAEDWEAANLQIDMEGVELSAAASHEFAFGLAAIRSDKTGAERSLKRIQELRLGAEHAIEDESRHPTSYFDSVYPASIRAARVMETQLESLILLADGRQGEAVQRLKDAVAAEDRMPFGYGPPLPVKPSRELLGEVLLNLGKPSVAREVYTASLERTPRRTSSLLGLLKSAKVLQDDATIKSVERDLSAIIPDGNKVLKPWLYLPLGPGRTESRLDR